MSDAPARTLSEHLTRLQGEAHWLISLSYLAICAIGLGGDIASFGWADTPWLERFIQLIVPLLVSLLGRFQAQAWIRELLLALAAILVGTLVLWVNVPLYGEDRAMLLSILVCIGLASFPFSPKVSYLTVVLQAGQVLLWLNSGGPLEAAQTSPILATLTIAVMLVTLRLRLQRRLWRAHMESQRRSVEAREAAAAAVSAAEQAARSAQARGQFLARMSHEIRTPLNGVLGMIELVREDGPLTPEQAQDLQTARSSGELLLALVNDVLDFSRSEQQPLPLAPIPVRLRPLLADVLAATRSRAQPGVELRLEVGPAVPEALIVDPSRLRQLLFNLVGNALKFTHQGEVVVEARWDGALELAVVDSGIGVPEDTEALFDPFRQGDESVTREYGGTGLGLAISKQIVDAMSGSIQASLRPEGGSIFLMRLPLVPGEAPEDRVEVPDLTPSSDLPPLLLAEDNPVNQVVIRRMCEALGFSVVVVGDGHAALEALSSEDSFVAVLMDHHMPRMGGLEAARRARAMGVRLPIIGVTASVLPEDVAAGQDAGMNGHLGKPLRPDELRAVLERELPQGSWLSRRTSVA